MVSEDMSILNEFWHSYIC